MKKKIIIASATVLFAVATVFNMNLLQGNSVGDVSLESIEVMAQAQAELLPEVTISCGKFSGPCWIPYGTMKGETWIPCYWTGSIVHYC
ncbi:MAG: hypothetical protein JW702_03965 [Clostridiales bacterium]|nr:hypothetical protein [Clostridiales bacterium]